MRRREFIAGLGGVAVAWPLAARAQPAKMPIIGYLGSGSPEAVPVSMRAFRQGLGEAGYVEGKNVVIEYRWMGLSQNDRIPPLVADLVRRQAAVIVVMGGPDGTRAAMAATATIPIVFFTGGDPVAFGLVASLNRPGGNVTGATALAEEVGPKRLELMHELLPEARLMALAVNPNNSGRAGTQWNDMKAAAGTLGVQLHILSATTERDFDAVFATFAELRAAALVLDPDPLFRRYVELAIRTARQAIPTISFNPQFVSAGGLMSYGNDGSGSYRAVGIYTGRILKGEKPADLPVQQATKELELAINLKTGETLGLVSCQNSCQLSRCGPVSPLSSREPAAIPGSPARARAPEQALTRRRLQPRRQHTQYRDEDEDDGADRRLDEGVIAKPTQRIFFRPRIEIADEARRQPQSIDCGNRQHDQKKRDLHEQKPAVIRSRSAPRCFAGEHPAIDDAGGQDRDDGDDAECRKPQGGGARNRERVVLRPGGTQHHGQRNERPDPRRRGRRDAKCRQSDGPARRGPSSAAP